MLRNPTPSTFFPYPPSQPVRRDHPFIARFLESCSLLAVPRLTQLLSFPHGDKNEQSRPGGFCAPYCVCGTLVNNPSHLSRSLSESAMFHFSWLPSLSTLLSLSCPLPSSPPLPLASPHGTPPAEDLVDDNSGSLGTPSQTRPETCGRAGASRFLFIY